MADLLEYLRRAVEDHASDVFILSARKIYSRGCTSKKIGAIIKEKGGGG